MSEEKENHNIYAIYAAPGSSVEQVSKDEHVLRTLRRQQSITLGVVIAIVATIAVLELLVRAVGYIPMFAYLIPGFVAGGLVKVLARPFTSWPGCYPA